MNKDIIKRIGKIVWTFNVILFIYMIFISVLFLGCQNELILNNVKSSSSMTNANINIAIGNSTGAIESMNLALSYLLEEPKSCIILEQVVPWGKE